MAVAGNMETIGNQVVQQSVIQCFICKGFRHIVKEYKKPKRVKDYEYHTGKMMLCKQESKDSGYTKQMTGNLKLVCNFVKKYLSKVRFRSDQFAPILEYRDLVQGNVMIKRVYYKIYMLFRDLQGNDLLKGTRRFDLYTIALQESSSSTPIYFMEKYSPTQAWLWHCRLSHLNFDTINLLSKNDIMKGLPKFKYVKDQLCSSCELDDEPMLAVDRVVAPTPGSAITIPETANEFSIKDFDALLDEGSKILHSIKGTLLEEEIFAEFYEFMAMTADENSDSESDTEEPQFKKITINTNYKIKTSLKEPPMDLELKPLHDNMEYVFLEEPYFLSVIISSQLFKEKKNKLISILKKHKQAFA
uniref:Integrase, catalytic region, zinc finger, CCHC-type, peptidase aspartic, catalytic n=1 Tax=Tanacetum cinerariifolium TaxID=118510 RepID=A0A699HBW6_TANCI|nr:integrase, catalytic region, zinc finger, CCHC-type, peptidase aspartic, catalytic [Tanacetum cinerariifolium]